MPKRKPVIHKRVGRASKAFVRPYSIICSRLLRPFVWDTSHTWAGTNCLNCLRLKPKGEK